MRPNWNFSLKFRLKNYRDHRDSVDFMTRSLSYSFRLKTEQCFEIHFVAIKFVCAIYSARKRFCNLKHGKAVSKNILYLIAMNQELKSPATVSRQPLSPEVNFRYIFFLLWVRLKRLSKHYLYWIFQPYNPFNMRLVMLQNLYNWHCANKTSSRSLNLSLQRNKWVNFCTFNKLCTC